MMESNLRHRYTSWAATIPVILSMAGACLFVTGASGQQPGGQHIERRLAVDANASVKAFVPSGSVRIVAWDRDTIVVTGTIADDGQFFFGGNKRGAKFGVESASVGEEPGPAHLVIYVPAASIVSIKCVSADIDATNASGWFYTVDGNIRLRGSAREVQAEAMSGDINMTMSAPWVRMKTGSGALELGGHIADAEASSITGRMLISATGLTRGKFGSVTGDVVFAAPLGEGGIFEFDDHSGSVELRLPSTTTGLFQLTTIGGIIDNGLTPLRPASAGTSHGQALAFRMGSGGARVTVRTFKGAIRLRH